MGSWWLAFLAFAQDPWAGVKAWRERRDRAVMRKAKPTYDPYPDRVEIPVMRLYVEARDAFGRIRREYVDLRGYGLEHVNLEADRWRDDVVKAIKVARTVLTAKLRLAQIHKTRRDAERGEAAFEQAMQRDRGQMIVELALLLPVMLSILLGMVGVFYLDLSRDRMQDGIEVLTELAARDTSWRTKVASEDTRTNCNGGQPDVAYPDGNQDPGSRVLLTWHCRLETRWVFDGLPISVSSEDVIQ